MSTDLNERVGVIESRLKNHEQRIQKQEDNNEMFIEMRTLLKNQSEINKEQSIQMKEFSTTLMKINDNLTVLNISQAQLKDEMNKNQEHIDKKISKVGERVSHIEKSQDERKIDPVMVLRYVLWTAVTGAIMYGIYLLLGIN